MARRRMTAPQRRDQLIGVGRKAFAERGLDGISMEEIAARAGVSKPVVYEHFGSKEGLYQEVVRLEMARLEQTITSSIQAGRWRERIERGVLALLTYVEDETDGFVILAHGQLPGEGRTYSTILNRVTAEVSHLLAEAFQHRGLDEAMAGLYGQALVGTVSNSALWWLDERTPDKETVAAHISNLCWNGLRGMEAQPRVYGAGSDTAAVAAAETAEKEV
ncbi:HTH-type transcriptional repressor KstR2 [Corynebacterium fournieri]|nr:TetR/AcrR family transcriptional regulator [Corynebacterium fournieri]WJY97181.1 HTH-type transcriptional repressor KstR2 [Corynebacterium fournieri]